MLRNLFGALGVLFGIMVLARFLIFPALSSLTEVVLMVCVVLVPIGLGIYMVNDAAARRQQQQLRALRSRLVRPDATSGLLPVDIGDLPSTAQGALAAYHGTQRARASHAPVPHSYAPVHVELSEYGRQPQSQPVAPAQPAIPLGPRRVGDALRRPPASRYSTATRPTPAGDDDRLIG